MILEPTKIQGVYVIKPELHEDSRGYFYESFNCKEFFDKTGIEFIPVQENISKSSYNVLRGLHFQKYPHAQAKLVRVIKGGVFDVAVDLRKESDTYGQYVMEFLSEDNKHQLFIPKGFAHGFFVASEEAIFQYKCDDFYHPECEDGIAWNDSEINIEWPIFSAFPELSDKDKNRKSFKEFTENEIDGFSKLGTAKVSEDFEGNVVCKTRYNTIDYIEKLKDYEPMHTTNDWEVHFETPPKAVWIDEKKKKRKSNKRNKA